MSERQPRITSAELLRALRREGWVVVRQVGSHVHLKHPDSGVRRITVPAHPGRTLKPATLASILDEAGLTVERLRRLL